MSTATREMFSEWHTCGRVNGNGYAGYWKVNACATWHPKKRKWETFISCYCYKLDPRTGIEFISHANSIRKNFGDHTAREFAIKEVRRRAASMISSLRGNPSMKIREMHGLFSDKEPVSFSVIVRDGLGEVILSIGGREVNLSLDEALFLSAALSRAVERSGGSSKGGIESVKISVKDGPVQSDLRDHKIYGKVQS